MKSLQERPADIVKFLYPGRKGWRLLIQGQGGKQKAAPKVDPPLRRTAANRAWHERGVRGADRRSTTA
ncbi:hypothetical protein SBA3_910008 [Candidatus Sulfopaludibacter sp. SbA3]|nr:hypothetical protein SBA3_910008 [Candidatus Sulfopaludibacter sp. SbA3]